MCSSDLTNVDVSVDWKDIVAQRTGESAGQYVTRVFREIRRLSDVVTDLALPHFTAAALPAAATTLLTNSDLTAAQPAPPAPPFTPPATALIACGSCVLLLMFAKNRRCFLRRTQAPISNWGDAPAMQPQPITRVLRSTRRSHAFAGVKSASHRCCDCRCLMTAEIGRAHVELQSP